MMSPGHNELTDWSVWNMKYISAEYLSHSFDIIQLFYNAFQMKLVYGKCNRNQ